MTNTFGTPYTTFAFIANDGEVDSDEAMESISIVGQPYVATLAPSIFLPTSAQLNGLAKVSHLASLAWFEWGPDNNFDRATEPMPLPALSEMQQIGAVISNLSPRQRYSFRAVLSNAAATVKGHQRVFTTSGKLVAWGYTNLPTSATNCVAVASGREHGLALRNDGKVFAWGAGFYGQTTIRPALELVTGIAAGEYNSFAIDLDGIGEGWGYNTSRQNDVPFSLQPAIGIAAGLNHSVGLRNDGKVLAWGAQTNVPTGVEGIVAVACGRSHSVALRIDGSLVAWGNNVLGQTNAPEHLRDFVAIASGGDHNLALRSNGTVMAWGHNGFGQTNVPGGLSNVIAVTCGARSSYALRNDGAVVGWGLYNPLLNGLSNIVGIAAGETITIALLAGSPPRIVIQPENHLAIAGSTASFSVSATGAQPFLYQWQREGVNLAGANLPTLSLSNLSRSDAENYRVIVSNVDGNVPSSNAFLRVLVPQQVKLFSMNPVPQFWFSDAVGDGVANAANVQLEVTTNLLLANTLWTTVTNNAVVLSNGLLHFRDIDATNFSRRFYRVIER